MHFSFLIFLLGTVVHNIEFKPGKGGAIARSAGAYAQIVAREGKYATIKLPSGETRLILVTCRQLLELYLILIIVLKDQVKQVDHAGKDADQE